MSANVDPDDLSDVVRYALDTTRATMACPFHDDVIIRVGDDAAESHAFERAKRIVKTDLTMWDSVALRHEMGRQLAAAADGECPRCAQRTVPDRRAEAKRQA
ncbi:hypothetical protein [Bradyrhizobium niftali]|uniref:Uncharacterized protein n=1 Tax=Bradyrhizobium niftali TaxID=2560055 RepID=A0A4Y9LP87_9BRAD|nr:hypothetical protein [Bradyrhizobium niftali]TFV45338.1 hypothetical protein E4K65_25100 [Bradyrhizobium niftali]